MLVVWAPSRLHQTPWALRLLPTGAVEALGAAESLEGANNNPRVPRAFMRCQQDAEKGFLKIEMQLCFPPSCKSLRMVGVCIPASSPGYVCCALVVTKPMTRVKLY